MKVACLQFASTPFDLTRNLETAERLLRHAVAQGARVAVLPELFHVGYAYTSRLFAFAESADGLGMQWMTRLSRELGVHLAGSLLVREGGRIFNSLAFVEPTGRAHHYRKRHPFLWERCFFEAGREPLIVESDVGRVGLMVCWDQLHPPAWEAYRGRVDLLLIASSPPRFHRAVINFPAGIKVYLAQLVPALRARARFDRWYLEDVAERAAWLGAPVLHSVMAGRFVTRVPFARLSYLAAAAMRPRFWPLAAQAQLASVRATFYGTSAVFAADGRVLARAEGDEGIALADLAVGAPTSPAASALPSADLPLALRAVERLMRILGAGYYRRQVAG